MPEMITVTWNGTAYKVDRPEWGGGKVIALDQLEAWLKQQPLGYPIKNDLLAQVQAWKEGG